MIILSRGVFSLPFTSPYGYTQADLSDATGVSISFLSDLENGKETIELGKALYIAQMLGMDLFLTPRKQTP